MIARIIGPPGTGKTTFIANYLQNHIEDFEMPIVLSFSRSASQEVINRGFDSSTYHSLALTLLKSYLDRNHPVIKRINRSFGVSFMPQRLFFHKMGISYNMYGPSKGNYIMRHYAQTIRKMVAERKTIREAIESVDDGYLRTVFTRYIIFKEEKKFFDFDDLLLLLIKYNEIVPHFDLLIEDESQDSNPIQDYIFRMFANSADEVLYVGDPNQNIYSFNGAVPELFETRPANKIEVLSKSHRVPDNIVQEANSLLDQMGIKTYKFEGTDVDGKLIYTSDGKYLAKAVQLAKKGYTVAVLYRTNYKKQQIISRLSKAGFIPGFFTSNDDLTQDKYTIFYNTLHIIKDYLAGSDLEHYRRSTPSFIPIKKLMPFRFGLYEMPDMRKQKVSELLKTTSIYKNNHAYMLNAIKGLLNNTAVFLDNLIVDTYHKSKGREVDFVFMDTRYRLRTNDVSDAQFDPKDEARVLYVGMTRAKRGVIVVRGKHEGDVLSEMGINVSG